MLFIPSPLRLVKNDHMLVRWSLRRSTKTLLEKVIDVLDSRTNLATDNPQRLSPSGSLAPRILVSRQCLAKQPGMILEVTITKGGPRTADSRVQIRRGMPPDGTSTMVRENLDGTGSVERDNAIRCTELITDKLRSALPAIKEKDTWYRAAFLIVGF